MAATAEAETHTDGVYDMALTALQGKQPAQQKAKQAYARDSLRSYLSGVEGVLHSELLLLQLCLCLGAHLQPHRASAAVSNARNAQCT